MRRYFRWKAGLVLPYLGQRILEVGCGNGLLLEALGGRELLAGAEPDAGSAREAVRRMGGRADIRTVDVLSPGFLDFAALRPDTVLFMSVLEMVADDALALRQVHSVLVPGGRVVVFASALPGLTGELDRSFGQRRYDRAGLKSVLVGAGFRVEVIRYANLLGALGWWLDSRFLGKAELTPAEYRRRDALVPLAKFVDAVTGPFIGRTLIAVGRRE